MLGEPLRHRQAGPPGSGASAGQLVNGQWWEAFFPGMCLFGCVLSFNVIADRVRDLSTRKRSGTST